MLDSNDWPVAFLGALYAGVVPVRGQHAAHRRRLRLHARAQPRPGGDRLGRAAPTLRRRWPRRRTRCGHVIVVAAPAIAPAPARIDFDSLVAASAAARRAGRRHAATTRPSGSIRRARPAGPRARSTRTPTPGGRPSSTASRVLGLTESDVCFSAAKLYFAYGLGNALTFPLSVGASVVLMAERPTPDAVFKRWTGARPRRRHDLRRPSSSARRPASPACSPRPRCRRASAVALRMCSSAGEALPARDRPALRAPLRLRRSSTASARPRCCTSSSRTGPATSATAPPASRSPATRSSCAAKTAGRSPTARSATSTSRARARR